PEQPHGLTSALYGLFFMTSSPTALQQDAPTRDAADRYFEDWIRRERFSNDANDFLYAFDASGDYDPSEALEKIRAPLYAVNSADDEVNPPELGTTERAIERMRNGRYI